MEMTPYHGRWEEVTLWLSLQASRESIPQVSRNSVNLLRGRRINISVTGVTSVPGQQERVGDEALQWDWDTTVGRECGLTVQLQQQLWSRKLKPFLLKCTGFEWKTKGPAVINSWVLPVPPLKSPWLT